VRVRWLGIWEVSVPAVRQGQRIKFRIRTRNGAWLDKADPSRVAPSTAGHGVVVWRSDDYEWHDDGWMRERARCNALDAPMAVYEVHLGSWRRGTDGRWLDYRSAAKQLAEYALRMDSRTSSCCRSWSIRSTAPGAYQSTGVLRAQRALRHAARLQGLRRHAAQAAWA